MNVKKLFSLEGKKGFITGGARGIGECLANAFAELGADVAIVDIDFDTAKKTAARIAGETGRKVLPYHCDVSSADGVAGMMAAYLADYHTIDYAVNNAGIFTGDGVLDISQESFESVIKVNLNGVFYTAQAAARQMVKQGTGGSIISTASMSARIINRPQTIANYCASKASVVHLTKGMAVELAKYGVRINCISPGYIQTELIAGLKDLLPLWSEMMPEGARLGYPEDLIGAYVYFASDASQFATGSDLVIDGGYSLV